MNILRKLIQFHHQNYLVHNFAKFLLYFQLKINIELYVLLFLMSRLVENFVCLCWSKSGENLLCDRFCGVPHYWIFDSAPIVEHLVVFPIIEYGYPASWHMSIWEKHTVSLKLCDRGLWLRNAWLGSVFWRCIRPDEMDVDSNLNTAEAKNQSSSLWNIVLLTSLLCDFCPRKNSL